MSLLNQNFRKELLENEIILSNGFKEIRTFGDKTLAKYDINKNADSSQVISQLQKFARDACDHFKINMNPEGIETWKQALKTIDDIEGKPTFENVNSLSEIRGHLIRLIKNSKDFLFLNVGSWLYDVWDNELVEILKEQFTQNQNLRFIASSGPRNLESEKIARESLGKGASNETLYPVLNLLITLSHGGKGLVYVLPKRQSLHFVAGVNQGVVNGYFEEDHNELIPIRCSHWFRNPLNYFLFSGVFLQLLEEQGEQISVLQDFMDSTPDS